MIAEVLCEEIPCCHHVTTGLKHPNAKNDVAIPRIDSWSAPARRRFVERGDGGHTSRAESSQIPEIVHDLESLA
jgi:hypothetical protein